MIRKNNIIHKTKSLCPICLKKIDAEYIEEKDEVFFCKECREHGRFETRVWKGAENFRQRLVLPKPQPPKNPANPVNIGCPYDCGLCRNHKQASCCVLLEVSNICDLECPVCFASSNKESLKNAFPSQEEIALWYDMLMERGGPFNIQLSGGEPAMRDDLADIIRLGKKKGFDFFQLNTNGIRIAKDRGYLRGLKEAGLNTVFLQFDSLQRKALIRLRGRDILEEKLAAVENCKAENIGVVLVPTVLRGCNDKDLGEILDYAVSQMPAVRGVHFQPMSYFGRYEETPTKGGRLILPELLELLEEQTGGRIKAEDFSFGSAEHPLCSANADYIVRDGVWKAVKKPPASSCCCSCGSDTSRKAVAEKWSLKKDDFSISDTAGEGFDLSALDRFLEERKKNRLSISTMAFQDVWNLDLERLQRCYINIVSPDNKLIPFCSYNLTAKDGSTLYRENSYSCPLEELCGGTFHVGGRKLTERMVSLASLKKGDVLLDLCCGRGDSIAFLKERYGLFVSGIDASYKMIREGKQKYPSLSIYQGRAEEAIFEGNIDAIMLECSLSSMEDKKGFLENISQNLKRGAKLLLSDIYNKDEENIISLIKQCGFKINTFEDHTQRLGDLAIGLIMKYGSIESFQHQFCDFCRRCKLSDIKNFRGRGYYILVAEKI